MSNEIKNERERVFAERIIVGEYNTVVCLTGLLDGTFECWREGSLLASLGLLECAKVDFTRNLSKYE